MRALSGMRREVSALALPLTELRLEVLWHKWNIATRTDNSLYWAFMSGEVSSLHGLIARAAFYHQFREL